MFFAAKTVARQFIGLQDPIAISIHPMKHIDQVGIKFMLFDYSIFVAIQVGEAAIMARGEIVDGNALKRVYTGNSRSPRTANVVLQLCRMLSRAANHCGCAEHRL